MSPARNTIVSILCLVALSGCELVADFDRSKIPGPETARDASTDASTGGDAEIAADAGTDAAVDASALDDAGEANEDDAGEANEDDAG